jgi:hypothetical protein
MSLKKLKRTKVLMSVFWIMFEAVQAPSKPARSCAVFSGGESQNRVVGSPMKVKLTSQSIYPHTEMGHQIKWEWPHVL